MFCNIFQSHQEVIDLTEYQPKPLNVNEDMTLCYIISFAIDYLPYWLWLRDIFRIIDVAACFHIILPFWKTPNAFRGKPPSQHTIFLSLSVSGTQQTARMNDLGHGIDPRMVHASIHTDLPCQQVKNMIENGPNLFMTQLFISFRC